MQGKPMHPYHPELACKRIRVNILRHKEPANYFDLVPVRKVTEFTDEDGKITLMVPKFKSKWLRTYLVPKKKSAYFRIHLDETGSKVWRLIDGIKNTGEICSILGDAAGENQPHPDDMELRVTRFLTELYKSRFILLK
jgi:hypothetical protein